MQVVEHGSYTAAAHATGVPKSTISQRIAALERTAGTGLLRRSSRSFSLTEAGALFLPYARAIEDLAKGLEQTLLEQERELAGTLRISSSKVIAQVVLAPLVPRFLAQHSQVSIRVEAGNRLVDLVGEGFDMAVRGHIGPLRNSVLLQRVVARTPWSLVASPDWVTLHGPVTAPGDVPPGEVLYFSTKPEPLAWKLSKNGTDTAIAVSPRFVSDDMAALRASAIAGGGVTCLPTYLVAPALDTGQLVSVLPDWSPPVSNIIVLTPPKPQSSRLASAFSNFLAAEIPRVTHC